jgi:hypothetical protein
MLELAGASPGDTTVTFDPATGRTVLMRHGAPDNAIFAIIEFPPGAVAVAGGGEARVTIQPIPGRFGFVLSTTDRLGDGVRATFSYAIHFQEPSDAMTKYPSPVRFEQALAPARLLPDGGLSFLAGERPAADMLRLPIAEPGSYLLAVPK